MGNSLRKFELKTLEASGFKVADKPVPDSIVYKDFILLQLQKTGTQGLTVGAMKERLDLISSLEKAEYFWLVDENAHKAILTELDAERWAAVTPNIVQIIEDFRNAPAVSAELKAVT